MPNQAAFNALTSKFDLVPMPVAQVVKVAKSGGDFSTIQAAINSIGDASASKQYVVEVAPGVYTENVTSKDYVFIQNGLSGAVKIVGTFTATGLSGVSGIRGITIEYTGTADGQTAVTISGGTFYFVDMDVYLLGAANYALTGVSATSGTAFTVFNSTVWDRRSGSITKNLEGWLFSGAGTFGIFNASCSARAAYASGTQCLFKCSATGSFTASGGAAIYNSSAAFSGEVRGWCLSGVTTNPRIVSGHQVRLQGTSGGTAYGAHLDTSSSSGEFQFVNHTIFINGFSSEVSAYANTTDTIKMFQLSTNKDLATSGTGASILTPYHLNQSGFIAWQGSGNYYSFVPGTGVFTLLRACTGMVRSSPVSVAANQTFTLPANNVAYFVYATSAGVLSMTADPSFEDKILLFTLFSDGTNYAVSKQTHPAAFPSAVSGAWHNTLGSSLYNDANGILTLLSGAGKTLKIVGSTTYSDHGLTSTVADSSGAAISLKMFYTGTASNTYINGAAFTAVPSVYQDTSTTIAAIPNGKFCNFRVGVYSSNNLDDTAANQNAQYVIIPDGVGAGVVYNSSSAAAAAITANNVAAFPAACKNGLEVINLGYITIQGDGTTGGGTITAVTPAKQVFGVNFASGTTSSAGSVTTDTTNFNGELSSSETSSQLAFERLDDYDSLLDWGTGKTYRVGNVVRIVAEGFIGEWRCVSAHTAAAAVTTDINTGKWEIVANSEGSRELVNAADHRFAAGDVLYYTGSAYAKAKADVAATAEVVGVVTGATTDYFVLAKTGKITKTAWGLTAGAVYFLSDATDGAITATEPTTVGSISKPILIATSTTTANFVNMRGTTVGGTNLFTSIGLANNAATTVQALSTPLAAGQSCRLEGTVKIAVSSGTSYTFWLSIFATRAQDGTTYNVSYSTAGGDVPAGFSVSNSTSSVQITLPNVTNFSSATYTFSINGVSAGAQLPLSISASTVVGSTTGTAPSAGMIGEKIAFTLRTTTGSSGNWVSNTTKLATLTTGIWSIRAAGDFSGNNAASLVAAAVSTNNTADATGRVADIYMAFAQVSNATGTNTIPMREIDLVYVSGASQDLYAKSYSEDAAVNVSVTGFAVRIV